MSFVNGKISAEDFEKYGLADVNKDFIFGPDAVRYWTIDREKNIYFRWMKGNWQEPTEQQVSFFWKGALFHIDFKVTGGGEKTAEGRKGWTHWSWNGMRRPKNPNDQAILDANRTEILTDLKDALCCYKDAGILSSRNEHTATFDF